MATRDYVNEALDTRQEGETPEDLLMRALEMLTEDARGDRMMDHARGMRGEAPPMLEGEEMAEGEEPLPPECMDGTCEHPEHQHEDMLPEVLEG